MKSTDQKEYVMGIDPWIHDDDGYVKPAARLEPNKDAAPPVGRVYRADEEKRPEGTERSLDIKWIVIGGALLAFTFKGDKIGAAIGGLIGSIVKGATEGIAHGLNTLTEFGYTVMSRGPTGSAAGNTALALLTGGLSTFFANKPGLQDFYAQLDALYDQAGFSYGEFDSVLAYDLTGPYTAELYDENRDYLVNRNYHRCIEPLSDILSFYVDDLVNGELPEELETEIGLLGPRWGVIDYQKHSETWFKGKGVPCAAVPLFYQGNAGRWACVKDGLKANFEAMSRVPASDLHEQRLRKCENDLLIWLEEAWPEIGNGSDFIRPAYDPVHDIIEAQYFAVAKSILYNAGLIGSSSGQLRDFTWEEMKGSMALRGLVLRTPRLAQAIFEEASPALFTDHGRKKYLSAFGLAVKAGVQASIGG